MTTSSAPERTMKVLLVVAILAALVVAGRAALKLRGNRLVERPIGTLATVRVPARLDPWEPTTTWLGTHFRLTRLIGSLLPGGNPTYHEELEITQLVPAQLKRLDDAATSRLYGALGGLDRINWEGPVRTGQRTVWHGRTRYTSGSTDLPAHVVRLLDTERGVAVTYRSLERQGSSADAQALAEAILDSYQLITPIDRHFTHIERNLGAGIHIALPVEFFDPYSLEFDESGVRWMLFRHHPDGSDDPELLERALAVAAFFTPGSAAQEATARAILQREVLREAMLTVEPEVETGGIEVSLVRHEAAGRTESAWLATGFDVARGVGIAVRLWQHDATRADAVSLVVRALASYRFDGDPGFFTP